MAEWNKIWSPPPLLSCESSLSMKGNSDRKEKKTYLFDASLLEETPDRSNSRIWESFL